MVERSPFSLPKVQSGPEFARFVHLGSENRDSLAVSHLSGRAIATPDKNASRSMSPLHTRQRSECWLGA